ncbi:HAD family hydrolase [Spiroplasma clarkii]|uniref:HAD family hydrolase n=1 Tax=Spiroplasma clarkii TaxID=2139 RepID=UPI0011BAD69D|nr:HAD hydrolase family protein [Spiroplasma clarkii]
MKWWFSDYDGTLNLDHSNKIKDKDLEFIRNWKKQGNKFVVATGRMVQEISTILEGYQIDYDYLICNNGATVYDSNKQMIHCQSINLACRPKFERFLKRLKILIH